MKNLKIGATKAFSALFWTQFLGALNDNVYKNGLVLLVTFRATTLLGLSAPQLVALSGAVFIFPFFVFSAYAGALADLFPKPTMIRWVKTMEIVVMAIGATGFVTEHVPLLMVALFLMGLQSAIFGPLKYGILPDLVDREALLRSNAYVELGTFLAILMGTVVGGLFIAMEHGPIWVAVTVMVLAIAGRLSSERLPKSSLAAGQKWPMFSLWSDTSRVLRIARKTESVFLSILGISWFWLVGAIVLSILPELVKTRLYGGAGTVTLFLGIVSVGIGAGAVLCGRLSFHRLELGLVPAGSFGITLFLLDAAWALHGLGTITSDSAFDVLFHPQGLRLCIDFFLFSVSSGLFTVPLYTVLQERSEPGERSKCIGANNILNAGFMVVGSVLLLGALGLHFSFEQILFTVAGMNVAVSVYIYGRVPEFALRLVCWLLARVLYRLRIEGRDWIPNEGAVILVCNHVSYVDWLILSAAVPRNIRFVMHQSFMHTPGAQWLFRDAKVIPIASAKEDPGCLESAFSAIDAALAAGECVCLFPEGKLSTDGNLAPFRPGIDRIRGLHPVPVVPMYLSGLWGSLFSRAAGTAIHRPARRLFWRLWSRIGLRIGRPVAEGETTTSQALEDRVRQLGAFGG
jgi:1-acyl-sn-glycerol-3-phosphate acyltransferase